MSQTIQKLAAVALMAAIATVLSGCYTYKVTMKYTCDQTTPLSANGLCLAWDQVGGVETPTTCFPEVATVYTKAGPTPMAKLRVGDEILGMDHSGEIVYTAVRAWMHRDVHAVTTMTALSTKDGTVLASPRHSLATSDDTGALAYQFADEFNAGGKLLQGAGIELEVDRVYPTTKKGLYAPLTWTSNFFVGGPGMDKGVLAHNFAELRHPQRYEGIWHRILTVLEFVAPAVNHIDNNDGAYVHPVARFFMHIFGWSPVRVATEPRESQQFV